MEDEISPFVKFYGASLPNNLCSDARRVVDWIVFLCCHRIIHWQFIRVEAMFHLPKFGKRYPLSTDGVLHRMS